MKPLKQLEPIPLFPKTGIEIFHQWHGGMSTAFYAIASTGQLTPTASGLLERTPLEWAADWYDGLRQEAQANCESKPSGPHADVEWKALLGIRDFAQAVATWAETQDEMDKEAMLMASSKMNARLLQWSLEVL